MKILPNTYMLQVLIFTLLSIARQSSQTVYTCNKNVSCGCSTSSVSISRIVGGENASSGAWSWAVSIRIGTGSLCGGSIISSSWVITAAHCVEYFTESDFIVYAGSNARWSGSQNRTVSKVIPHANFNPSTYEYDIALLQLSSPLNMSDPALSKICLPNVTQATLSAGEWPSSGTSVVTIGWGRLSEIGSLPSTLQQVTLQTVSYQTSTCLPVMVNWHVQFCATVINGTKDTCQGDSGGPMMMFSSSNQWILVGLTSSGIGCARPQYAGLYTRVAAFQDWINSKTNSTNSNGTSLGSNNYNDTNTTTKPTTTTTPTTTIKLTTTLGPITLHASIVAASIRNVLIVVFFSLLPVSFY
ncbi:unnamed protein product [Rotaria magnacalcarata]|uniref:Peptidase S1 domain-containing protein n=1 Tax=Rotaria magnacalcarata TaxID=392030 RepID=A0A819R8P4_9BILA|nr:unnamed protein product [Rotaria magnacalcarata]CAF4042011.1 unnamed protein product [Rotaria magnacalcarata]